MEPNDQILGDTSMEIGGRRGTSTPATARGVACRRRRRQKKNKKQKNKKKTKTFPRASVPSSRRRLPFPNRPRVEAET